jgi:phosphatidylglycerophosphate synthase
MADYQPSARRPIANIFRRTANSTVRLCVRLGIHPDIVSYASIGAAAGAGICFWQSMHWPWLLLIGSVLCFVRLWFNMLDGMVALAAGKASFKGEIINELPDRISDVLIFVGVAYSGLAHPASGYLAAILALMTAYVGMLGQAVGAQRQFGGLMAKPWRMVVLSIGAVVTMVLLLRADGGAGYPAVPAGGQFSILDWACVVVVLGCVQTIVVRLAAMVRNLRNQAGGKS